MKFVNIQKDSIEQLKPGDVFEFYRTETDEVEYYMLAVIDCPSYVKLDLDIHTNFSFTAVELSTGLINWFTKDAKIRYRPDIVVTTM